MKIKIGSNGIIGTIFLIATAMVGYSIHHSLFWSVMDFFFAPFAWIKWLVCRQVTWSIIKHTFDWFFQ